MTNNYGTQCPYCGGYAVFKCADCEHTQCHDCGAGGYCDCPA